MTSDINLGDSFEAKEAFFQKLKMLTHKEKTGVFNGYLIVKIEKDQTSSLTLAGPFQAFIEKCAGLLGFRDLTDGTLVELEAIALFHNNKQWIQKAQMSKEENDIINSLIERVELSHNQVFKAKSRPAAGRLNEVIAQLTTDAFQNLSIPSEKSNPLDRFVEINHERLSSFQNIVTKLLENGKAYNAANSIQEGEVVAIPEIEQAGVEPTTSIEVVHVNAYATETLKALHSEEVPSNQQTSNKEKKLKADKHQRPAQRKVTTIGLGILSLVGLAWGGAHLYHQYHAAPINLPSDSNMKDESFKEEIPNYQEFSNPVDDLDVMKESHSEDLQNPKQSEPNEEEGFIRRVPNLDQSTKRKLVEEKVRTPRTEMNSKRTKEPDKKQEESIEKNNKQSAKRSQDSNIKQQKSETIKKKEKQQKQETVKKKEEATATSNVDRKQMEQWERLSGFRFYKQYCSVLEINPNANLEQIREAYNRALLKCHPDKQFLKGEKIDPQEQERAQVQLKKVREAFKYFKSKSAKHMRAKMGL